jgi:hypothetical protein
MLGFISGCSPARDTTEHLPRQADKMAAIAPKTPTWRARKKFVRSVSDIQTWRNALDLARPVFSESRRRNAGADRRQMRGYGLTSSTTRLGTRLLRSNLKLPQARTYRKQSKFDFAEIEGAKIGGR